MKIQCEHPTSAIHQFTGTFLESQSEVSLDESSLLLRGSSLRNTRWIIGVVVFTGRHTKLVMNSRGAPFKISGIEKTMNNILLVVLMALFLLSLVSLVAYIVWTRRNFDQLDYLCYNFTKSVNPMYRQNCESGDDYTNIGYFFTFFILYSNFLPISLYVTVEICNYYLTYYIDSDIEMYDPVTDTPAVARTSNMNADLGMVEYIFSDKTGRQQLHLQ
jgi:phospholipid-transporting ATPase